MESALRDVRIALRQLPAHVGFTVTAVATLGLGVGTATALFSVIEGTRLRPLPFPESDRILAPVAVAPDGGYGAVTYADARVYVAAVAITVVFAGAGALVLALRAAHVNPLVALRAE